MSMLNMWERLGEDIKKVGCLVGVEERFIVKGIKGTIKLQDPQQKDRLGIHQRFFTTLALLELAQGNPLSAVADSFGTYARVIQCLQKAGENLTGIVTEFCHKLGWDGLAALLTQFQD